MSTSLLLITQGQSSNAFFVRLCFHGVIHTRRMRKCDIDGLVGTFTLSDTEIDTENVTMGASGTVPIHGFRTHACNPL